MTGHMPPIPPGNRSNKGPKSADADAARDTSAREGHTQNTAEQGDTANIKQNTTNKGLLSGPAREVAAALPERKTYI